MISQVKELKIEIDNSRDNIKFRKYNWTSNLVSNLYSLTQILEEIGEYLIEEKTHSTKNLGFIREEMMYTRRVIKEDVFQLKKHLLKSQTNEQQWDLFINEMKELFKVSFLNAVDELDNYYDLLGQKQEVEPKQGWSLLRRRQNIKVLREQRRKFIDSFFGFKDHFAKLVTQLKCKE